MEQQPHENNPIPVEFEPIEFVPFKTPAPKGWGISGLFKNNKCVGFVAFGPDGPLPGSFPSIEAALAAIHDILNPKAQDDGHLTDDPEDVDRPPGG